MLMHEPLGEESEKRQGGTHMRVLDDDDKDWF